MGKSAQLEMPPPRTWGGKRRGAGRKRKGPRPKVAHVARPEHNGREPVLVTMRRRDDLPSLRRWKIVAAIEQAIAAGSRNGLRITQFSIQRDHLHLMVEADDRTALSRGMQGFTIRAARAINRVLLRNGPVWADRYHARLLASPRQVRNAIRYVLLNWQKHVPGARGVDPCSSGASFDGWRDFAAARDRGANHRAWAARPPYRRAPGPSRSHDAQAGVGSRMAHGEHWDGRRKETFP
jgi:REP-associated tyrosine transposase